ncbi:MAG: hypothetical protein U9Q68_01325 [Euryarchaeota archaeon]|nr:hypothetical protein [Euryarchaeota archaeon]
MKTTESVRTGKLEQCLKFGLYENIAPEKPTYLNTLREYSDDDHEMS